MRLAGQIHFASPRQNGAAAFTDRSVLADKSASFQEEADIDDGVCEIRKSP
jgi:hypothetical protein